jgi:gluconate:H+ symporter, GntP family
VLIRLATGSATVATVTASSLMLGLVEGMTSTEVALAAAWSVMETVLSVVGFVLVLLLDLVI